jgi:hypothetical protein
MKKIWVVMLLLILSFSAGAQNSRKVEKNQKAVPSWAEAQQYDATAHVYFPDYYTFYDAARGGYVYWENGKWSFSPSVPSFLEKVDMSKSRIKILKGLSLDLHPEQNYPYYIKMYPPDGNGNTNVPVPIPGNPAK